MKIIKTRMLNKD